MRTNIEIDDDLLSEVMEIGGLKTKKAAVDAGLRKLLAEYRARRALDELAGIGWDGDLEKMREDWTFDEFRS